jgi:ABC-type sugar transport system substrate-binding protein
MQDLISLGIIDPELVINPYEGMSIKPDGTPYRFAWTPYLLAVDFALNAGRYLESLLARSGAEVTLFDPGYDSQKQVAFCEDVVSLGRADALVIAAVNEAAVGPIADQAMDKGIRVYAYDIEIYSSVRKPVTWVHHDFDGPAGSNVVGEYYAELAAGGKQINLLELWNNHAMETSIERHNGFHAGLGDSPNITVIESADCMSSDELAANIIMDEFTAHPELNAVYVQAAGSTGCVQGLDQIGRLLPMSDPNHVIVAVNDMDTRIFQGIDDENVDGAASHGPVDMAGVLANLALTDLVLGQPVVSDVTIPMVFISHDNYKSLQLFGVPAAWPFLPTEQWDLWPAQDTTSIQIPTPTKAMRLELLGY